MMLAELSAYDPPVLIAGFCACLMFLFMGANAAMDFWRNIKDKPTGAEVMEKARKEFVSKHEFDQFKQSIENDLKRISRENQTILSAGQTREQHLTSLIEALDSRIDELPQKMIEQLKATLDLFDRLQKKAHQ
ncbi:MAG TPA: hypothetical protein VG347_00760 [Verrucomicrobiae bacterium]|nr:hypothetical protein [Verrucomicrobiae bacterium]